MCRACWDEMGSPHIDTPEVRAAVMTVRNVDNSGYGSGYLHAIIDDWNLEDEHIASCAGLLAANDQGLIPEALALYAACLDALRPLSEDERASALAINEGWTTGGAR